MYFACTDYESEERCLVSLTGSCMTTKDTQPDVFPSQHTVSVQSAEKHQIEMID